MECRTPSVPGTRINLRHACASNSASSSNVPTPPATQEPAPPFIGMTDSPDNLVSSKRFNQTEPPQRNSHLMTGDGVQITLSVPGTRMNLPTAPVTQEPAPPFIGMTDAPDLLVSSARQNQTEPPQRNLPSMTGDGVHTMSLRTPVPNSASPLNMPTLAKETMTSANVAPPSEHKAT